MYLFQDWHRSKTFAYYIVILWPRLSDRFHLSVELIASSTIEVIVSNKRLLGTSERKHWQWDWYWHIDTNLPDISLLDILSGL